MEHSELHIACIYIYIMQKNDKNICDYYYYLIFFIIYSVVVFNFTESHDLCAKILYLVASPRLLNQLSKDIKCLPTLAGLKIIRNFVIKYNL